MTTGFEDQLETRLRDLADRTEPPSADLHLQVRERIARKRRRRTAVLTTGIAACSAGALALTLAAAGGTAPSHRATPASSATSAIRTPAAQGSPWWLADETTALTAPDFVTRFWDARGLGAPDSHTGVRVLYQGWLGQQVVMLVVGRRADGAPAMALVSGARSAQGAISYKSLQLLGEDSGVRRPSAPVALEFASSRGTAAERSLKLLLLAPPCTGQLHVNLGPGAKELSWPDPSGMLVEAQIPVGAVVTVHCDTSADPGTAFRLNPNGRARLVGSTDVSLLTAP